LKFMDPSTSLTVQELGMANGGEIFSKGESIFCFWNERNPLKFGRDRKGIEFEEQEGGVVGRTSSIVLTAAPKPLLIKIYGKMKWMYP
jgi:hypothetical protein